MAAVHHLVSHRLVVVEIRAADSHLEIMILPRRRRQPVRTIFLLVRPPKIVLNLLRSRHTVEVTISQVDQRPPAATRRMVEGMPLTTMSHLQPEYHPGIPKRNVVPPVALLQLRVEVQVGRIDLRPRHDRKT